MTPIDPVMGLGAYMREVAEKLSATEPMTFEMAYKLMSGQDLGYAAATLFRLEARGVAAQTIPGSYLYIRGPRWNDAAAYYKWEVADVRKED